MSLVSHGQVKNAPLLSSVLQQNLGGRLTACELAGGFWPMQVTLSRTFHSGYSNPRQKQHEIQSSEAWARELSTGNDCRGDFGSTIACGAGHLCYGDFAPAINEFRYHRRMEMWERLFRNRRLETEATGISILLLQKRPERFSTDRLNAAMQRGWHRAHNSQTFFALSVLDGDGAVLKVGTFYVTMQHIDRRLERRELGRGELPNWAAEHSAYSSVEYKCPGGVPEGENRDRLYGFLGLLCVELMSENICGLFFLDEQVAVPNSPALRNKLRSAQLLNPRSLAQMPV